MNIDPLLLFFNIMLFNFYPDTLFSGVTSYVHLTYADSTLCTKKERETHTHTHACVHAHSVRAGPSAASPLRRAQAPLGVSWEPHSPLAQQGLCASPREGALCCILPSEDMFCCSATQPDLKPPVPSAPCSPSTLPGPGRELPGFRLPQTACPFLRDVQE